MQSINQSTNHYVDLANKIRLNSIEGPLGKNQAYDSVSGTATNGFKQKVIDKVRKFDRDKTVNLLSVKELILYSNKNKFRNED
ncbi:hypothetical protein TNCV_1200971 [Trichonephila clavipes]|nr:hypothetical protein TNCV_1200971 [Trichonephila clavipes]